MRFFTGGIKMSRHVIRNSKLRKYMLGYTNKSASGADDFFLQKSAEVTIFARNTMRAAGHASYTG